MARDTKTILGKRHLEVIKDGAYTKMIYRTVTKVKSGANGYERYYANIEGGRVEVYLNTNGRTGASFTNEDRSGAESNGFSSR